MLDKNTITKAQAKEFIIAECKCDDVGLWECINRVKEMGFKGADVKVQTLSLIKELLENRLIVAGEPAENGKFRVVKHSPDEIISLIDEKWGKLGKEPTIADIIWFSSPENPHEFFEG